MKRIMAAFLLLTGVIAVAAQDIKMSDEDFRKFLGKNFLRVIKANCGY